MPWLSLLVTIFVVALLTAGATAVRAVSRLWLRHWIEHRQPATQAMRQYLERPARLAHAAGTGTTLAVFVWGAILAGSEGDRPWAFARDAVIGITLLLVLGQLLPRAIGRRWAPQLVPSLIPVLRLLDLTVTPFLRIAHAAARLVAPRSATPDSEAREGLENLLHGGRLVRKEHRIIHGMNDHGHIRFKNQQPPVRQDRTVDRIIIETKGCGQLGNRRSQPGSQIGLKLGHDPGFFLPAGLVEVHVGIQVVNHPVFGNRQVA